CLLHPTFALFLSRLRRDLHSFPPPRSSDLLLLLRLRLFRLFPLVRFSARINRRGDRFLLPGGDFFALLDQVFGALFQFPRFPLRVFASLVSLLHQKFAGFLARLRREQDADQRAEAQPNDEVSHFRSEVIAHSLAYLHCQASIPADCLQGIPRQACNDIAPGSSARLSGRVDRIRAQVGVWLRRCWTMCWAWGRVTTRESSSRLASRRRARLPNRRSSFSAVHSPIPGISTSAECNVRLERRWR